MALQPTSTNFLSAETLSIDPKWHLVNAGNLDIAPPPEQSDSDDPHMPSVIGAPLGQAGRKRQFYKKGPGLTLAEQLGIDEVSGASAAVPSDVPITAPISVPPSNRIVPTVSTPKPDMDVVLTPQALREAPKDETKVEPVPPSTEVPRANLKEFVLRYIQTKGIKESSEFFAKSETTINNWVNGKQDPTLSAAQKLIDAAPKARSTFLKVQERVMIDWETGEGSFARGHTKEELPVDLCLCTDKDLPPYVAWVFITAVAQYGIGMKMQTDTVLPRARNMVAKTFLDGKATWSIWLDHDVLPTIGNPGWWRSITRDLGSTSSVGDVTASYDFIKRLLSHNKPFVGGVYPTRRKGGPLVTQLDLHPRNQSDRLASDQQRKNTAKGLYGPVEWLSCGLACIHRVVFETIQKNHPEVSPKLKGEPYPFFTQVASEGEDCAFSKRAIEAGFKLYLDQELFAAHIGRFPFLPGESAYNGPVDFTNSQT